MVFGGWSKTNVSTCLLSSFYMDSQLLWRRIYVLQEVVLPCFWEWLLKNTTQQDSALCHTSSRNQNWLWENFCEQIISNTWPPKSPDCNPHLLLWLRSGWERHQQKSTQCWKLTEDENNASIYQLKYGDCWKKITSNFKVVRRPSTKLMSTSLNKLINNIWREVLVIFLNISDNMGYHY